MSPPGSLLPSEGRARKAQLEGGDLRERVVLERREDAEADLVAVVLLGSCGEGLEVEYLAHDGPDEETDRIR